MVKARLRSKSNVFTKGERFVKSDAQELNVVNKAIIEPATLTVEKSARVRLRCAVPRRIASDLSGFSAR